jgi:hypothetical protein
MAPDVDTKAATNDEEKLAIVVTVPKNQSHTVS